jgi:hypothetical protein
MVQSNSTTAASAKTISIVCRCELRQACMHGSNTQKHD